MLVLVLVLAFFAAFAQVGGSEEFSLLHDVSNQVLLGLFHILRSLLITFVRYGVQNLRKHLVDGRGVNLRLGVATFGGRQDRGQGRFSCFLSQERAQG